MSDKVPQYVMDTIHRAIKDECEPIVQQAINDCEATLRNAIHRATVSVAKEMNYNFNSQHFVVSVTFREPRK